VQIWESDVLTVMHQLGPPQRVPILIEARRGSLAKSDTLFTHPYTYMGLCSRTHSAHCTMQALTHTHMPCTRMQAMEGNIHIFVRKHANAHWGTGDAVVYNISTRKGERMLRLCPATSITEQGPSLPATLLPAALGLLPGAQGRRPLPFHPTPWNPGPLSIDIIISSGQQSCELCVQNNDRSKEPQFVWPVGHGVSFLESGGGVSPYSYQRGTFSLIKGG